MSDESEKKTILAAVIANPWPIVALLLGGAAAFAAIAILAPPETRDMLFGAQGLVFTLIALWMRSPKS